MSNRELLELAAKAAGIDLTGCEFRFGCFRREETHERLGFIWNPLINDGHALRLAVALKIAIVPAADGTVRACVFGGKEWAISKVDRMAATREAITRVAADIGKAMP